jgi:hypothetical protein
MDTRKNAILILGMVGIIVLCLFQEARAIPSFERQKGLYADKVQTIDLQHVDK